MGENHPQRIDQLLTLGEFSNAISAIKAIAPELLHRGQYSALSVWVEKIPSSIRANDEDLSLIFAQTLIHTGEVHEAGSVLTNIIDAATNRGDWLSSAKALIWRSAAHRLAGNLENALTDAKAALSEVVHNGSDSQLSSSAHFRMGNALFDAGKMGEAIDQLQAALDLSANSFDLDLTARIHNSIGAVRLRQGNTAQAAVHFEQARQGWAKTGNSGCLAATLNSLAYIYQRLGQLDQSIDLLHSALHYARDARSIRIESSVLIALGVIQRDRGEFDTSLTTLKESLTIARDALETNFVSWAKAEMGDTLRRMKQYPSAVQLLTEAVIQADELHQTVETDIFNVLLGIAKFMNGDENNGIELLLTTAKRLEVNGDPDALARCSFFLACCFFHKKDYEKTVFWLDRVRSLINTLGYHEYLVNDGEDYPLVIHFAASKPVGGALFKDIQKRINERLKIKHGREAQGTVAVSPSEVEIYALGDSKVWIYSKPVADSEWRSLRAKELFYYLACHPKQTGEQIACALWPELASEKVTNNFHTNLYRARRATSPGVITTQNGRYELNQSFKIYFDVSDFLGLSAPRQDAEDDSEFIERLEQAMNLYHGPFLDGLQGDWIETLRHDLEDKYIRVLKSLGNHYKKCHSYDEAISVLEKAIKIDVYQDELYCDLIECHIAYGDRLSALRTYQQYDSNVLKEMGSQPPPRLTQMLHPLSV